MCVYKVARVYFILAGHVVHVIDCTQSESPRHSLRY